MNTLVEIGPNLVAALERIDPGETPVTQIATVRVGLFLITFERKRPAPRAARRKEAK